MFSRLVAKVDEHYSPARIAGLSRPNCPLAEGEPQQTRLIVRRLQRRNIYDALTRRYSPGYNISRFQRQDEKTFLRKVR